MPSRQSRPYFPPRTAYPNMPAMREVDALTRGEMWTRQGLVQQAGFAAEYTKNPQRQAAWLVGLAACTANDDSTQPLLAQAIAMGLPLEDAAQLAVFSYSHFAAKALGQMGVDWTRQMILPRHGRMGGPSPRMDAPVEVFMESALDPQRADQRYCTEIQPVLALDEALSSVHASLHGDGFLQGISELGIDGQSRVPTQALGLKSGKACLLSLAIANRAWPLARQWMSRPLEPSVRDEALLACAMLHEHIDETHADDRREWEFVVGQLVLQGARADAQFEFRQDVADALNGYGSCREDRRRATPRQWFLRGALGQPTLDNQKWQPWLCPQPLPRQGGAGAPRGVDYWCEWFNLAWMRVPDSAHGNPSAEGIMRWLLQNDPVAPEKARDVLDMAIEGCGRGCPALLDSLLDPPPMELAGSVGRADFLGLLRDALGLEDGDEWTAALSQKCIGRIWRHPRLAALQSLLRPEDAAHFASQIDVFRAQLDELWPQQAPVMDLMSPSPRPRTRTVQEDQALSMALVSAIAGFERGVSPSTRSRRTL